MRQASLEEGIPFGVGRRFDMAAGTQLFAFFMKSLDDLRQQTIATRPL
jgi:hypothetical protein